jgi:hypothetical protein
VLGDGLDNVVVTYVDDIVLCASDVQDHWSNWTGIRQTYVSLNLSDCVERREVYVGRAALADFKRESAEKQSDRITIKQRNICEEKRRGVK